MKSICLIIPYFGKFPEWFHLFFETLKLNPSIDFIIYTDADHQSYKAKNVRFHQLSFEDYVDWVNTKLPLDFRPSNPFKLCDLRPLFGYLHEEDFIGYDFYGWTDMDILFGDIRSFYTAELLNKYEVISTHEVRISGHLALFKNNVKNRYKYKSIYNWKSELCKPEFVGIDEHGITNAYTMTWVDRFNEKFNVNIQNALSKYLKKQKVKQLHLKEQYTTPFTVIPWLDGSTHGDQPDTWYYKDGKIWNSRDSDRNFIYLHLMNFKSSLWRHDGTKAPWEGKSNICSATVDDMKKGLIISPEGINPITN